MSLNDIVSFNDGESSLGKDSPQAVVKTSQPTLWNIKSIWFPSVLKVHAKCCFYTIRPHDQFIYGLSRKCTHKELIEWYQPILQRLIPCGFIGSVEKNNDNFIHFHLIIKCSNTKFKKNYFKDLTSYFSLEYNLKRYQTAIKQSKLDSNPRKLILYYLGVKEGKFKGSYITNIIYDFPIEEVPLEECSSLLDYYENYYLTKKQLASMKKDYKTAGYIDDSSLYKKIVEKKSSNFIL